MKRNESNTDRIVRGVLGIALVGGGLYFGGTVGIVLYVLAAIMLLTAVTGFCPLYAVLGFDTCGVSKKRG